MKVRIPVKFISDDEIHNNKLQIGFYSTIAPSSTNKSYWQFNNITPAELDCWLDNQSGEYQGVKIDKQNWERFPFLQTL